MRTGYEAENQRIAKGLQMPPGILPNASLQTLNHFSINIYRLKTWLLLRFIEGKTTSLDLCHFILEMYHFEIDGNASIV